MEHLQPFLNGVASGLGPFAPRVLGALALLLLAWLAARLVRAAVLRAADRAGLDARMHYPGFAALLADMAQWLVWLLALPALLGTLELKGLLDPVNAMVSRLLGFLPNLLGAGVVLGVGLLVGNIARRVVTGMLTAAGAERLADKLGLRPALGERTLAGIVGSMVFALVLLPTLAASLDALGLDAVTRPVSHLLDSVVALVPRLASAALVLVLAALLGRALASVATGVLAGMGLNRLAPRLGLGDGFRPAGRDLSELAGAAVMATVMFVALAQAAELLGFAMLTDAVTTLGGVLARCAVAVLVMGVGLWLATWCAQLIEASGVAHGRALGRVARLGLLFFAGALALRQAGLPAEIVAIAFGSVMGALALGVALAIGLGGQQVAHRLLVKLADAFDPPAPPPSSAPSPVSTPATEPQDGQSPGH